MPKEKVSFVMYDEYWKHISLLDDTGKANLLQAIFSKRGQCDMPKLDPMCEMAFSFISTRMDADLVKWEETCKKRAESGKKGGVAKASNAKQNLANVANAKIAKQNVANLADNDLDPDLDIESDNDIEGQEIIPPISPKGEKQKRFVPPSLDEVHAYCKERNNRVDPQRFIDHYTSNGWMVGKNKMKDWKAAVRTWEKNSNGNTQSRPDYSDTNRYAPGSEDWGIEYEKINKPEVVLDENGNLPF